MVATNEILHCRGVAVAVLVEIHADEQDCGLAEAVDDNIAL